MSMQPFIPDGWEVQLVSASRPRRGEVWAFCSAQGDIIVHRYRRFEGGAHVFRGDVKQDVDAPVSDDQLIGRVTMLRGAGAIRTITARDKFVWQAKQAQRALRARGARVNRCRSR
jgi:hypothetical protein